MGKPFIKDFAPYAYFCVRANLLLAVGLTNNQLFSHHKHNRRDLEYCYYLPHCEIFSSKDNLQKNLIPLLVRTDQSFVHGDELKNELIKLSNDTDFHKRGRLSSLPEDNSSIVFKLWQKHRKEKTTATTAKTSTSTRSDPILTSEECRSLPFEDYLRAIVKKIEDSDEMLSAKINELRERNKDDDPRGFLQYKTLMSRERLLKKYPHIKLPDLD